MPLSEIQNQNKLESKRNSHKTGTTQGGEKLH